MSTEQTADMRRIYLRRKQARHQRAEMHKIVGVLLLCGFPIAVGVLAGSIVLAISVLSEFAAGFAMNFFLEARDLEK